MWHRVSGTDGRPHCSSRRCFPAPPGVHDCNLRSCGQWWACLTALVLRWQALHALCRPWCDYAPWTTTSLPERWVRTQRGCLHCARVCCVQAVYVKRDRSPRHRRLSRGPQAYRAHASMQPHAQANRYRVPSPIRSR